MIKASKRNRSLNFQDPGKAVCQMNHALKRIRKRLGIKLTEEQYSHIVSCIKNSKESDICKLTYLKSQSKRLAVYEIIFEGYEPVNLIYDKFRKTIVTVLFPTDAIEINYYYDIFNNKVNVKHDLGYNKYWWIDDGELIIDSEIVVYENDYYEVKSEGTLNGKRFKFDGESLYEVM